MTGYELIRFEDTTECIEKISEKTGEDITVSYKDPEHPVLILCGQRIEVGTVIAFPKG